MLAAKPVDAVISNLAMQGMGGVELLKAMKASPSTSGVPVIVVTTSTSVDAMNSCRALGCAGFVLKPVDVSYLKAKLRRLFA